MASVAGHAALVERLQIEAREAPQRYRLKLALLALAGYAVLVLILAVALGLPLGLLIAMWATGRTDPALVYAILLPGAFGVVVLRALWIRFAAPTGYALAPGAAPLLEAEVERLRAAVGAPPLDGIVIDGELNASASDVPRAFGLLGHRHYLVLGLPMMQLLDRAELASVIAHEFGHFGARHGPFTGWIYRVRLSWYRVLDGLSNRGGIAARLLGKFFAWYVPYFNAYSFVLARSNEYEADAAAARATGAEIAASALIRVEIGSQRLQRGFWPRLLARVHAQRHPPLQLQADIARLLQQPVGTDLSRLAAVTRQEADLDDTHPPLAQRLAAMDAALALRGRADASAASEWLGDLVPKIERQLDAQWRSEIEAQWIDEYQTASAERNRLAEIEGRAEPTPAETLEYARLIEKLRPDFDALPLYEKAIECSPDSAMAHYRAGLLDLRDGNGDNGIARLRRAMQLDPGAIRPVLADVDGFVRDPALNAATAAALMSLRDEFAPRAQSLDARDTVAGADDLQAHDLDETALHGLRTVLARSERVAQAWLARKRIDMAEELPHYVILVDWRGSVVSEAAGLKRLSDAFDLPGSHSVMTDTDRRDMARRVRQACGEPIYRKGR